MRSYRPVSSLHILKSLEKKDSDADFTNVMKVVVKQPRSEDEDPSKQKFHCKWFMKQSLSNADATREVIAQEIMRLLIPGQPKTRLATDQRGSAKDYFIMSKEVPNFHALSNYRKYGDDLLPLIQDGKVTGMGHVMVAAMFVNEIDLKPGNMGTDHRNRVIKIDGDLCFARLMKDRKFKAYSIAEADIATLPDLNHYDAYHWYDLIFGTAHNPFSGSRVLSHNERFRHEVNEMMLRILAIPKKWFESMLSHYVKNATVRKQFLKEILDRQAQIHKAAMKNTSFIRYFEGPTSNHDLLAYSNYAAIFTTVRKQLITHTAKEDIAHEHAELMLDVHKASRAMREPDEPGLCTIL